MVALQMDRGLLHHGNLGIARSLGRLGVPVYLFQDVHWAPAARSRYVRQAFVGGFQASSAKDTLARLLDAGGRLGRRAILIPTDDVAALFVSEHDAVLRQAFCFPRQPPGLPLRLASKKELFSLCQQLQVPTPRTAFPRHRADVLEFIERSQFPVVLKSIDARLLHRRPLARSVFIAREPGALLAAYDASEVPEQPNFMLQEYIPGGAESIWMFNGYFDARSDCLFGATGQKIRQYPPHTGATSLGVCVPNQAVDDTTRALMKALGYRGILDIGYRYDVRDRTYKLLDANPRIGATFRLFVGDNGLDVARALYLDLTGQTVPASEPRPGRKWVVENRDLDSCMRYWRERQLSAGGYIRSLRGVQELAWFAADDPEPFALMCAVSLAQSVGLRRRSG
ncbi:MAG: carboxylate--amine ligase [Chloroflexi bacterium]|nr:carboxylate--amine ligase [Chloroflexota bacterium]